MFAECSGEPSTDWQQRWFIRRLTKLNKSTIDKLPYPEWYQENPQLYNSTRRPLPPSSTPLTYIHDPDYDCDPYHNLDLYDQVTLTFKETINVPFHDFVKMTNMNLDITKRAKWWQRQSFTRTTRRRTRSGDTSYRHTACDTSPTKPQTTYSHGDRTQVILKSSGTHKQNPGCNDVITIIPPKSWTPNKHIVPSNKEPPTLQ